MPVVKPIGVRTFGGYKPRPLLPTGNISEAENISLTSLRSDLQQKQDSKGGRDSPSLLWAEMASAETPARSRHCRAVPADPEGSKAVETLL